MKSKEQKLVDIIGDNLCDMRFDASKFVEAASQSPLVAGKLIEILTKLADKTYSQYRFTDLGNTPTIKLCEDIMHATAVFWYRVEQERLTGDRPV